MNSHIRKDHKNDCKLGNTFKKNGEFAIADTRIRR